MVSPCLESCSSESWKSLKSFRYLKKSFPIIYNTLIQECCINLQKVPATLENTWKDCNTFSKKICFNPTIAFHFLQRKCASVFQKSPFWDLSKSVWMKIWVFQAHFFTFPTPAHNGSPRIGSFRNTKKMTEVANIVLCICKIIRKSCRSYLSAYTWKFIL